MNFEGVESLSPNHGQSPGVRGQADKASRVPQRIHSKEHPTVVHSAEFGL